MKRKLRLLCTSIIFVFGCVILMLTDSYKNNAVEQSSVLCEQLVSTGRWLEKGYAERQQKEVQVHTLNKSQTVMPVVLSNREYEIEVLSVSDDKEVKEKKEKTSKYTKEEIEILQRITEAECTGQSLEAKKNVASVIINRVNSKSFPNNIEDVVFQKHQFSPISDGRYYKVTITDETREAIEEVLKNGVTNDALFFCNQNDVKSAKNKKWFNKLVFLFTDDSGHSFYK